AVGRAAAEQRPPAVRLVIETNRLVERSGLDLDLELLARADDAHNVGEQRQPALAGEAAALPRLGTDLQLGAEMSAPRVSVFDRVFGRARLEMQQVRQLRGARGINRRSCHRFP